MVGSKGVSVPLTPTSSPHEPTWDRCARRRLLRLWSRTLKGQTWDFWVTGAGQLSTMSLGFLVCEPDFFPTVSSTSFPPFPPPSPPHPSGVRHEMLPEQ